MAHKTASNKPVESPGKTPTFSYEDDKLVVQLPESELRDIRRKKDNTAHTTGELRKVLRKIHAAALGHAVGTQHNNKNIGADLIIAAYGPSNLDSDQLGAEFGDDKTKEILAWRTSRLKKVKAKDQEGALKRLRSKVQIVGVPDEKEQAPAPAPQLDEQIPGPKDVYLGTSVIDTYGASTHPLKNEPDQLEPVVKPGAESPGITIHLKNVHLESGAQLNIKELLASTGSGPAVKGGSGTTAVGDGDVHVETTPKGSSPRTPMTHKPRSDTEKTPEVDDAKMPAAEVKVQRASRFKQHNDAKAAFEKRDFEKAVEAWEQIINTPGINDRPQDVATAKFNLAFALSRLGDQQRRNKDFVKAHKTYNDAGKNLAEVQGMDVKARNDGGIKDKNMQKLDSRIHNSRGCNYYGQYTSEEGKRGINLVKSAQEECTTAGTIDNGNINAEHNVLAMNTILSEGKAQEDAQTNLIEQVAGLGERATHTMHWNAAVCNNQLGNPDARDTSLGKAEEKLTEAQKKSKDDGHKKQLEAFGVKIKDYRKSHSTDAEVEAGEGGGEILFLTEDYVTGGGKDGATGGETGEPAAEAAGSAGGAPGEVAEEAPREEAAETPAERNARLLRDGRIGDDGTIKTQEQGLEYMDPTRGDTYEPAVEPRLVYGRDENDNRIHAVQWGVDGDLHEWVFEDNQLQDGAPPLGQDGHIITPEGVIPARIGGMDQLAHIDETVEERNKRLIADGYIRNRRIPQAIQHLDERTPAGHLIPEPRLIWRAPGDIDEFCHSIQRRDDGDYWEWMHLAREMEEGVPPLNENGLIQAAEGREPETLGNIDAVRRRLQGPPGAAEEEEDPGGPPGGSGPDTAPTGTVGGGPVASIDEPPETAPAEGAEGGSPAEQAAGGKEEDEVKELDSTDVEAPPQEPLEGELIQPEAVKPPDNPLDVSFRSRLAAIFGKGKERVQAAKAVAQWFDGDQFKKVAKDHTAVAYGLCGRMRDGTADPHIFGKFNDLVSGGEDLTGETGLTGTGIPELEQHAQALGLSKDEFKEAFFLEFAKRMEKRYPLHDDLVRVVEQGDTAVGPPYALQYVNNFGKLYAVFKNGTKVMHCPLDEQGNPTEWVVAISGDYERKRLRDYIDRRIIGHGNIHFKGVRVPPEWIQKSV